MTRIWRLFIAAGVLALLTAAIALITRVPRFDGVALPVGKVEPWISHDLMLAPDGTLWTMVHSGTGGPSSIEFVPFAPGENWKQVAGGRAAGVALKQNGTLWCWDKTASAISASPVQIGSDADWACVKSCGGGLSPIALKTDGTLHSFGHLQSDGQIVFQRYVPGMLAVQIGSDRDWKAIEAGAMTYCALKDDGTLWNWGWLSTRPLPAPSRAGPDTDWRSLGGGGMLVAIKGEGSILVRESLRTGHEEYARTVYGWRPISEENSWHSVVSAVHSVAAKHKDGSWHVWGDNSRGQLGLPKASGASLPVASRSLPFGEPRIEHLTKVETGLDIWVWSLGGGPTILLARDGVFYCMGGIPGKKVSLIDKFKSSVNVACYRIGVRQPFDTGVGPFRNKPVRIGQLPPSVISALKRRSAANDGFHVVLKNSP